MLIVDVFQRRHHPLRKMFRMRTHQRQLHPSSSHIQWIAYTLCHSTGQSATDQFCRYRKYQTACILFTRFTRPSWKVFHAEKFQIFETVEGETGVGNHTHEGGDKAAIEGASAALLFEDGGGGVYDACVDVLAGYLCAI